jgi:hypothetical protein
MSAPLPVTNGLLRELLQSKEEQDITPVSKGAIPFLTYQRRTFHLLIFRFEEEVSHWRDCMSLSFLTERYI